MLSSRGHFSSPNAATPSNRSIRRTAAREVGAVEADYFAQFWLAGCLGLVQQAQDNLYLSRARGCVQTANALRAARLSRLEASGQRLNARSSTVLVLKARLHLNLPECFTNLQTTADLNGGRVECVNSGSFSRCLRVLLRLSQSDISLLPFLFVHNSLS